MTKPLSFLSTTTVLLISSSRPRFLSARPSSFLWPTHPHLYPSYVILQPLWQTPVAFPGPLLFPTGFCGFRFFNAPHVFQHFTHTSPPFKIGLVYILNFLWLQLYIPFCSTLVRPPVASQLRLEISEYISRLKSCHPTAAFSPKIHLFESLLSHQTCL